MLVHFPRSATPLHLPCIVFFGDFLTLSEPAYRSSAFSTAFERDVEIPHLVTPAPSTLTYSATQVANLHFCPHVHATGRILLSIPFAVEALLGSDGASFVGGLRSPMIEGSSIDSPTGDSAFPGSSSLLTSPSSSNWSTYALSFSRQKANPDLHYSQIFGPLLCIRTHVRVSSIFILQCTHQPVISVKRKPALRPPSPFYWTTRTQCSVRPR